MKKKSIFKKFIKECDICKGIFGTHDDIEHILHDALVKQVRMQALNKVFGTKTGKFKQFIK
jgi:F0F1-type ATP synthase delta subunit